MVDVEVVVARGSRGLELGELLLRCLWVKMSYVRRRRCLEVAWEDAKGNGEVVERLLVLSS